jgi:hypothetical protein
VTRSRTTPAQRIIAVVADVCGVTPYAMRGKCKRAPLAVARGVAARLLVDRLGMHPAKIGELLERDRSTVIHALQRIDEAIAASDAGEPTRPAQKRELLALGIARAKLDAERPTMEPRSVSRLLGEAIEVAARLASRDTEEEAALLERAVDTAAHCLGALLAAERRLDKRERGEAKRTSPERVSRSLGALTAAAEEAATDGRH